jgi:hypothetical protein
MPARPCGTCYSVDGPIETLLVGTTLWLPRRREAWPSRRRAPTGRNGVRRERVVGVAAVMVGRSHLLRASGRVVFGAECARWGLSTRLVFGARLWGGLYSCGRVPQEATLGGFYEPWARLLLFGAAGDEPMGIHKRGPHGGLRSSGCNEGGPGLGGVVRSLFGGFRLLLLEGIVREA